MASLNPRITVEPGKMGGKPCIRGLRFTVYDVASYLASGMSEDEILRDFPYSRFLKLLVDENLAPKLSKQLSDLFPGSVHVTSVGLGSKSDIAI